MVFLNESWLSSNGTFERTVHFQPLWPSTLDLILESDRWYEDLIFRVVMLVVHGTGTNIPVLVAMSRPIFTALVGSWKLIGQKHIHLGMKFKIIWSIVGNMPNLLTIQNSTQKWPKPFGTKMKINGHSHLKLGTKRKLSFITGSSGKEWNYR